MLLFLFSILIMLILFQHAQRGPKSISLTSFDFPTPTLARYISLIIASNKGAQVVQTLMLILDSNYL